MATKKNSKHKAKTKTNNKVVTKKKKDTNKKKPTTNIKKDTNKTTNSKKETKKKVIKVEDLRKKKKPLKKKTGKSNAKKIASSKRKKTSYLKRLNKLFRKIKIYGIQSVIPLKSVIIFISAILILLLLLLFARLIINKVTYIDLDLIPEKIDQIQTFKFNIDDAENIINSSRAYTNDPNGRLAPTFVKYDEYDFEKILKLDKSLVKEHYIRFNKMNGNAFVVVKATNGNNDKVKEVFTNFFKSMNDTKFEYLDYQGYQIFINSSDNEKVIIRIKNSQTRVFNILDAKKKADIERELGIKDNLYKKALVKTCMVKKTDVCEYAIFKPKNNKAKKKIMTIMNNHYRELEEKWKDKDQVNYNMVVNRHFEEYHGYLIYVVSNDNDLVMQLIKS